MLVEKKRQISGMVQRWQLLLHQFFHNRPEIKEEKGQKSVYQNCQNFSHKERKEGGDELTGVNWVPVDPATHQATKIACAHPPSLSFGAQFS